MNQAYFDTCFLLSGEAEHIPDPAFIVTACNPMDQILSVSENKQRNTSLKKMITQSGAVCLPITGASQDLSHQEPGFLTNSSKEQVLKWARNFNQRAVFQIYRDQLSIIPCREDAEIVELGSFKKRWVLASG